MELAFEDYFCGINFEENKTYMQQIFCKEDISWIGNALKIN
ncbi:MAG: hypothetical protein RSB70_03440 [Clostridium sp.]